MSPKLIQTVHDERAVANGRRLTLEFRGEGDADPVPGILLLPGVEAEVRAPAALLLHGYSSRKERLADTIGVALLARGVASLAIDLPHHGARGAPDDLFAVRSPLELAGRWRTAFAESSLALRYLAARRELDRTRLALLGYSLGSYLGVLVAAREPSVRALVLAAGGDLPDYIPFAPVVRTFADPIAAVRSLAGRPLLMLHGRRDRTITPAQAERLYAAAGEPKSIRWYDSGHVLPPQAALEAASWLRDTLGE